MDPFNPICALCELPGGENVGSHLVNYQGTPKDFWVHGICIVLANGMNVHPEDVEPALLADARVKDAVVLGVTRGQAVEVHAVLLTQQPDDVPEIIRAANRRLAPHQQIHGQSVWPEETFPLTPTLKVKRGEVAEWLDSQERVTIA